MNNLREKAREIKAAGEAERGNFTPTGAPKRLYRYWLDNSQSRKANAIICGSRRENFCHFWRVVVIWAPLLALGSGIARAINNKTGKVILGLAILTAFVLAVTSTGGWMTVLVSIGVAIGIVIAVLAVVFAGLGIKALYRKYWNKAWNQTAEKVFAFGAAGVLIGTLTSLLILAVSGFGWISLVVIAGILLAIAGIVYGIATLAEFISGKRALAKAERERIVNEWINSGEDTPYPFAPVTREPGRLSKFFSGIADFLILASQIVRVKKWKICPMVEID